MSIARVVQVCDLERAMAAGPELVELVLTMVDAGEGRLGASERVWAGWVGCDRGAREENEIGCDCAECRVHWRSPLEARGGA